MSRSIQLTLSLLAATLLLSSLVAPATADSWWNRHGKHHGIEGSGVMDTRSFELDGFEAIRIDGVFEVEVTVGDEFSVELEAEDNLIDLVEARVRRGQLILDLEDDANIDTDESMRFTITMPSLVEVVGDGVYELYATGLDNELTTVEANGVGSIELVGETDRVRVEASGVGSVKLRELIAQDADVRVSGVGDVEVFVENELDARVDGLGKIFYYGDPREVDDRVDGFGSIRSGR